MRIAVALLALLLPGCLTAPVERADAALAARVEQIGAEVSRKGEELEARVERRVAPVVERLEALETESEQWRAESKLWRDTMERGSATWAERTDRLIAEVRATREAAGAESRAWRASIDSSLERVDRLVALLERAEAALTGAPTPAPPAHPGSPPTAPPSAEPESPVDPWMERAIGVLTFAGLAIRWWMNRKRARVSIEAARWCELRAAEERGAALRPAPEAG